MKYELFYKCGIKIINIMPDVRQFLFTTSIFIYFVFAVNYLCKNITTSLVS